MKHSPGQGIIRNHDRADAPLTLITRSSGETLRLGEVLGGLLIAGDVVALSGELGAGKTCLTRGIARGLGVGKGYEITSPTFTLINEYPGRVNLYHMDLYRLGGPGDLADTGFTEYFQRGGVVVMEWAERAAALPADQTLWIRMRYLAESVREITISGAIRKQHELMRALEEGGF